MRSLDLSIIPKGLDKAYIEMRALLVELLNYQISRGAHESLIQTNRVENTLLFQLRQYKGSEIETIKKVSLRENDTFSSIMTIIVKTAGFSADTTALNVQASLAEFVFSAHTQWEKLEFMCLASMPKSTLPSAHFVITKRVSTDTFWID